MKMKYIITLVLSIATITSFCQDTKFTGYEIADVNQDSIINLKTVGYADKLNKITYSKETIQPIGSVSKTLIGISLMITKESWSELYKKNFTPGVEVKNIDTKEPNTGLFMVYFKSGKIGHSGSDPGVSCVMMFDPILNNGKLFMANEDITKKNLVEFKKIWGIQ